MYNPRPCQYLSALTAGYSCIFQWANTRVWDTTRWRYAFLTFSSISSLCFALPGDFMLRQHQNRSQRCCISLKKDNPGKCHSSDFTSSFTRFTLTSRTIVSNSKRAPVRGKFDGFCQKVTAEWSIGRIIWAQSLQPPRAASWRREKAYYNTHLICNDWSGWVWQSRYDQWEDERKANGKEEIHVARRGLRMSAN